MRRNRLERAAHFQEHGQIAVGTKRGVNMLVYHHHLHLDEHPLNVAQSQDGSNAYNEMETVTIAEGILTAPASHHAIYGYFFQVSQQHATKVYVSGYSAAAGEKCHAFLFKKGCKQGSPDATDLCCYSATYMLRAMANELWQHPDDYGYMTSRRSTDAMTVLAMAQVTPLTRDRPSRPAPEPSRKAKPKAKVRVWPFEGVNAPPGCTPQLVVRLGRRGEGRAAGGWPDGGSSNGRHHYACPPPKIGVGLPVAIP